MVMKHHPAHKKIVLIDDDTDFLELCAKRLRHHGFHVELFDDPAAAMKAIRSERPDLVISDVKMPGLNGFEVCDCLRSQTKTSQVPIILMTGLKDKRQYVESLNVGRIYFLTKPFESDEFLSTIRTALDDSIQFEEHLTKI
ncbi:MAG: hypothetical protein COW12_02250 [Candidatus Omnitrophica bacterium CG12_big_fil_rev_8_21_14_0_65_45_16]|nr:MAG: hypothetical protein COW12_02250 [Candidatus Omnitrophica bacterium CG12_big_fil_rev_8_21_14_0_65_45_16]